MRARRTAARQELEHARERALEHRRVLGVRVCDSNKRGGDAGRLGEEHRTRHVLGRERALEQREHARVHRRLRPAILRLQRHHERAEVGDRRARQLLRVENLLDGGEDDILVQKFGRVLSAGVVADVGEYIGARHVIFGGL